MKLYDVIVQDANHQGPYNLYCMLANTPLEVMQSVINKYGQTDPSTNLIVIKEHQ